MLRPLDWALGLLSLDIGIDLGTANTLVSIRDRGIVINEPSWVAINKRTRRPLAIGAEAREMVGRTPADIVAIRPLRDGVISEFEITEAMLKYFIDKAHEQMIVPFPRPRVVVGVPSGVTEVEKRAVYDATISAGAREAYLIEEPMAQISSFLNFLAHIIPEWLQIAKEEDNRLQDAVPEVSEYDQVMRQSLNEVIAYYEDVIANLRQEIAELKMSKEAKKHSELSIAALLETEEVSEKEDERSCKDKLMDKVQSIRDTLNNLKRELEGLSLIFDKAYAVKVFSESIHLVSVPFFLLVPREGEKTFESHTILYPSILSAQRRYRGEGFDNFVFSSPIGLHIKEALQQKEVSPSIIQEAVQGWDFFEFKHKPFVDVGKQGLRKRNLIE